MSWEVRRSRIGKKGGGVHGAITYAVIFVRSLVAFADQLIRNPLRVLSLW